MSRVSFPKPPERVKMIFPVRSSKQSGSFEKQNRRATPTYSQARKKTCKDIVRLIFLRLQGEIENSIDGQNELILFVIRQPMKNEC